MSARTRAELAYSARTGRDPQGFAFAPGRLVLLGEHVDHQGGRVLAVPLDRGVHVAWGVRPDRRVVLSAPDMKGNDQFSHDAYQRSGRPWADLARGVFARLARAGLRLPGFDLAVAGDVLPRKGMASSAAYVVALLKAALDATGKSSTSANLARAAAAIEAEWVGVPCGTMDGYVAAAGEPGRVVDLECAALTHETLDLPDGVSLIEEDTMVERSLSDTPYRRRVEELSEALADLRRVDPKVTRLAALTPEEFERLAPSLGEPFRSRARHVVTEQARVAQGVEALTQGDGARLGRLMNECHESLSKDFDCSLPSIDARVREIRERHGVLGARLQGAGWGGVIAVLRGRVPQG